MASLPSNGIVMLETDDVNAIALPVVDKTISFSALVDPYMATTVIVPAPASFVTDNVAPWALLPVMSIPA